MPSQRDTPAFTSSRGAAWADSGSSAKQAIRKRAHPSTDAAHDIFVPVILHFQRAMAGDPLAHRYHIMRGGIFPMRIVHVGIILLPDRAIRQSGGENAATIQGGGCA